MARRPRGRRRPRLSARLQVELVRRADQRRRWHEVGRVVFAAEPRWSPPLRSYETWAVSRRHPYRRSTGAVLERWVVRGVGRIAAHHVDGDEVAWFAGFECADDPGAVAALVDAAASWAAGRGARVLRGPALYLPGDGDAGVLVEGFDHAGGTARPWHPPWYAAHLAATGLAPCGDPMPRWRLPTNRAQNPGPRAEPRATGGEVRAVRGSARALLPPHAGRLGDPALVLPGIAAVPDVTAVARGRRARPTEASVVLLDGDPDELVPAVLAAASGYDAVWAPWSPDPGRPPDTVHRLFEMVADRNRLS